MSLTRLVRPVVRATPLTPILSAGVLALVMGWVASLQPEDANARMSPIRLGILALALGAAFLFDDTASGLAAVTPSKLWKRRLVRVVAGYIAVGAFLTGALLLGSSGLDPVWVVPEPESSSIEAQEDLPEPVNPFPIGRFVLETSTLATFALAVASLASVPGQEQPGKAAVSVLLGVYLISWMLPVPIRPWSNVGWENWTSAADVLLAVLGVSGLLLAIFSWEARQRRLRTLIWPFARSKAANR